VTSLKRCLSAIEKIDDNIPTSLFISASSQTAMDDAGMVSILAYPGPGCTPNEPIAFVARFSGAARSSPKEVASNEDLPPSLGPTPFETRYRERYKGHIGLVHYIDWVLQSITEFTKRTASSDQSSPPPLMTTTSGASASISFRPLTQPHPSCDVY
jgi:hypothetical protein